MTQSARMTPPADATPADQGSGGPAPQEWTVDQLAHEHGLPVSTLRLYQNRGLLPPPVRRGRLGFYGPDHVARLELIAELQERGFSLAGIKELLDGWQDGRSLNEVLGLASPGAAWEVEAPVVIDPADLVGRFAGAEITPELMERVVELGLIELTDDGRLRILSPRFLEIGTRLTALGFPVDEIIEEYEQLTALTAMIADRFTEMFRRNVWQRFADEGMPASRVPEITGSLQQLGPLAQAVLENAFGYALQASAQRFLDEQADALAAGARRSATSATRAPATRTRVTRRAATAGAAKASATKPAAPKAGAAKAAGTKAGATKAGAAKAAGTRAGATKAGAAKAAGTKAGAAKAAGTKAGTKAGATKAGATKAGASTRGATRPPTRVRTSAKKP
jgi:DNA-binding transcriptional MerR regulator